LCCGMPATGRSRKSTRRSGPQSTLATDPCSRLRKQAGWLTALTRGGGWRGCLGRVCDHAATGWGDGVGDERTSAADLAALQTAVLGCHEALVVPPLSRRTQWVVRRLRRLHLSWLLAPWFVVELAGMFWRGHWRGSVAGQARAERLYARLSGKDPHVARRAEVSRMVEQLGSLDERMRWRDEEPPGPPRGADRAELEAAAGALIGYYVTGRRTDDALLGEVQIAWAEYEGLVHERLQRDLERGRRGRRRVDSEVDLREQAAIDRYLLAWRRWLDRRARPGTAGEG